MAREHEYITRYEATDPATANLFREWEKEFDERSPWRHIKSRINRKSVGSALVGAVLVLGAGLEIQRLDQQSENARQQAEAYAGGRQDQVVAAIEADGFTTGNPHTASAFYESGYGNENVMVLNGAQQVQVKLETGEDCTLAMVTADYESVEGRITDVTAYAYEPVMATDGSAGVVYRFANAQELRDKYIGTGEIC